MKPLTDDNKLLIITKQKTSHSDLSKSVDQNIKIEINFIVKNNDFLTENAIKNKIRQLSSKYNHENGIY